MNENPVDALSESGTSLDEYSDEDSSGSEQEVTLNILERQPRITAGTLKHPLLYFMLR